MIEGFSPIIDCRKIPDRVLLELRKLAVGKVLLVSPALAEWLRIWCETEEVWRHKDPDNRPAKHAMALPPVNGWSNSELGSSLRAITALSFVPMHGSLDNFVDRITLTISEEAGNRLEKQG